MSMKNKIVALIVVCVSTSIMAMDQSARSAEQNRQNQLRMEQQHRDMVNAATARNYQSAGQLVPDSLMAQLDPGARSMAHQHNLKVLQQRRK